MPEWLQKFLRQLQKYSDRWWYLPLMSLLVFFDLFIIVIPSEGLLVKTVLLKPSRWRYAPLFLVTASAIGAGLLCYLTQVYGEEFVRWLNPEIFEDKRWKATQDFIGSYGGLAMALISLSPLPQQPAVVICGLAGMHPVTLALWVWLGRAPKYYLFAWLAKQSPKYFKKYFGHTYEELKTVDVPDPAAPLGPQK